MIIDRFIKTVILTCLLLLTSCAGQVQPDEPVKITPVSQLLAQGNDKLQQRQYVAAIFFYEQVIEQEPENTAAVLGIADASMAINNLSEAGERYEMVLENEPDNLRAAEGKGLVYFK
ncbi:MAG: tetratricopeptide repeat protein, partial [Gammaproteobacteria bacterium]|nr:tetratricopeptide repeat protein [Gammaproteobacteria bacterium]